MRSTREFTINLKGRVHNFPLPKNKPLVPLFEAVVNSLHAIEDRKSSDPDFNDGKIVIKIGRSNQTVINGMSELPQITDFSIIDNGVGFNEPNMRSFTESDSTYKEEIGGKGVGRLSWLVVFEKATIESIYKQGNDYLKRDFEFATSNSSVDDALIEIPEARDNCTTVTLSNCLPEFRECLPKKAETVASGIMQHCLVYFISKDCPRIILEDTDGTIDLNQLFSEKIKASENSVDFKVGEENFNLLHIKVEDSSIGGNNLYLCAHNRLTDTRNLNKYVTDLDREIYQECHFWYIGVLTGDYLDKHVNMNRLSFDIPEGGISGQLVDPLSMDMIINSVADEVSKYLSSYLLPIRERKNKRIKSYVANQAPQFRHLLKYKANEIQNIKPNLSDEKLDDELAKLKRDFDREIKKENSELLQKLQEGSLSSQKYIDLFQKQVEKVSVSNSAVLAEYVAHRKVIINLLNFALNKKDDGKFQKEQYIHNLIYPMRTDSDELKYDNHNLWLIDEKLAYCSYISSDIPFDNNPKEERPDIMILDHPVAVSESENDGSEFDTIVIFELKRPMRDDYNDSENPITQLYDYVDKIKSGKAKDKNGRYIVSGINTKFYLYVVCDVTPKLQRIIDHNDFNQTPDKYGFYKYNEKYRAYVEILP
ncbi:MAG: ATP-binding protein, partial [Ethanoligenens sp.]